MEERFYAGLELEKDLKMCAVFDELQNNNDVIILDHGRNVLINEMRYVNNYSLRNIRMRPKWGTPEYWKYWYWNLGGREKVQAKRKINEYIRYKMKREHGSKTTD